MARVREEVVTHLSGAGLVFTDLPPEEAQEVGSGSNLASLLYRNLVDVQPGGGKKFGPFASETEAKNIRPKLGQITKSLKWETGKRTTTGKRETPYVVDFLREESGWFVRVVRKIPLPKTNGGSSSQ